MESQFQFQMMDISSSGSSTNDVQQQQQQQQQNIDHLNMITNLNSPSASSGFSSICCGTGIIGGSSSSSSSGGAGNNVGGSGGGSGVGCGGGGNAINSGTEIFPIAQQLVSTNSFELNVVTSLSDDSGVPLTNSSISSGDSYRLGLCKLELELVESDGEVSQFDSLEDSSDGGMSAENFNTLKKGPLAPIDPPPEFQDSPQTTMLRSKLIQNYAINLSEHVIVTALNDWLPPQQKIINLQDDDQIHIDDEFILSSLPFDHHNEIFQKKFLKNNISEINNHYNKHHIYASDSLLNKCYNIYDEPDDHLISSCENSLDNIIITTAAATESTKSKQKQKIEEFDNEYNNKNCSSKEYNTSKEKQSTKVDKNKSSTPQSDQHLEIYDYNFYYALKKNYQRESYYQQHKRTPSSVLYSPLHHNHHHHHHHHHHHSNSSNIPSLNRPNSRNSLNSRLSSSHNSLTVPNANKADDSIFITQAMSHDALLSREISDFYNVPIGADIYSFPIDMIKPSPQSSSTTTTTVQGTETATKTTSTSIAQTKDYYNNKRDIGSNTTMTTTTTTINNSSSGNAKISSSKGRFKNTRNKKRRRGGNSNNLINNETATGIDKYGNKIRPIMINASSITTTTTINTTSSSSSKTPHKRHSVPENTITPLQMTLDEVKKFYHSLYSSTSDSNETLSHINITNNNNCNNNNNNINNNKNSHIKSSLNNDHTINFIHNTGTLGCSGGGSLAATTNYLNNTISTIPSSIGTSTSAAQTSSSAFNNATTKSVNLKNLSNEKNKYNNKSTAATTAALHIINKHDEIRNSSNNISGNNKYMITSTTGSIITQSPSAAATLNHQQQHQYHHHHQQQQNNHQIQQHHNQHHQNNQHNHHHHHNNTTASEKKSQFFINLNLKQKFCSIFRFRKSNDNRRTNSSMFEPPDYISNNNNNNNSNNINTRSSSVAIVREDNNKFSSRALPPLPNKNSLQKGSKNNTYNRKDEKKSEFNSAIHFASNIEKVKDYGWYWGPISSEAAEKILSNEPDGSFIVRDSSDDHYIFSLSFKLNNCVRHVRIEQDQGTFSFGSYAKFKSQTITEFIEKAVEHSRSGRYLFFLHRRPEHGPMRVQLTNPVSRFKHIQSLQHMCRFVILKAVVRKDLIQNLPLPRRLLDYLSYKHCYSEQIECDSSSQSQSSGDGVV